MKAAEQHFHLALFSSQYFEFFSGGGGGIVGVLGSEGRQKSRLNSVRILDIFVTFRSMW